MPTSDDTAAPATEITAKAPAATERFWAFISYSHRDTAIAARLQRDIESYRLPLRVVGRRTSQGVVPARLRPVFRDRSDLPAGADLRQTIRDALENSRWLIVICSPEAVTSVWVEREIEEFTRLHGQRRILAVIVRGEPYASNIQDRASEECLPAAYRIAIQSESQDARLLAEPAGVDLREHGDGRRIVVIKLVAGMTGLDVDELLRRDLQRRVRFLAGVSVASIATAMLLAGIAIEAYRARDEARRQRGNAEQLVEFMLGDLHSKLLPVGRLDLLDAVATRALKHYASQRAETLSPDELTHRARAYHLLGAIQEQRGSLSTARAAFARGAETTERLLQLSPNNPRNVFEHAQSMFWVGYVAWLERRMPAAETAFLEYLRLARNLHALEPNNRDFQL